jgi:hypothetical protein
MAPFAADPLLHDEKVASAVFDHERYGKKKAKRHRKGRNEDPHMPREPRHCGPLRCRKCH